jgi:hypothetical protein
MSRSVAIIDFLSPDRGGHYGVWMDRFADGFSRCADYVGLFAPFGARYPSANDLVKAREKKQGGIAYFDTTELSRRWSTAEKTNHICEFLQKFTGAKECVAFLVWAYDLDDQDANINFRHAALGGISALYRQTRGLENLRAHEERILRRLENEKKFIRYLIWDAEILDRNPHPKVCAIPDLVDLDLSGKIRNFDQKKITLGIVGIVTEPRGISLLCDLMDANPEIFGRMSGLLQNESWKEETRDRVFKLVEEKRLCLQKGWLSEKGFNDEIAKLDGLVIDSTTYPFSSSTCMRGFALGKCLISNRGDSRMVDMIQKHNCGLIVEEPYKNLASKIRKWYLPGKKNRYEEICRKIDLHRILKETFN